ncbi:MAG: geranylgeranyl transferase type-2 subunit beta [Pirellulaceae bacterium]|jgi:geranylgeranyl transferase type-2 subunit beta
MLSYLENLTVRLAQAVAELPADVIARHAKFLLAKQRPDGGFAGREGESDLYYSSFAIRSLAVLGELDGDVAKNAAGFLKQRLTGQETIVDFLSLVYGAALVEAASGIDVFADAAPTWRDAVADALEELRREDGGYAKGPDGARSSTYHTFLVILCLQLIERPIKSPEKVISFLNCQRSEGGGFREISASKRAGTNPTAAAIGTLKILDALDEETRLDTIDFLAEMQMSDGGLRANTRIPIADLLSTFTAVLTLIDLDGIREIDVPAARRFAESMQGANGGFNGAEWDDAFDVEYTFYGIGALALLSSQQPGEQDFT